MSSPYGRCVQTLAPLADRLGIPVEEDDRLAEGAAFEDTLRLMDELGEGVVLCTHGDVLTDTVAALERRGMDVVGPPDLRKGVVWLIDGDADGLRQARALPPPDRDPR